MSVLERHAMQMPDRIAYRMVPSGECVTWRDLELRSRKCAAALLAAGHAEGDGIAVLLENHVRYFEILWAAHRIGLYYTTISRHLKADEVAYLIADSGAKTLFCSAQTLGDLDPAVVDALPPNRVLLDADQDGFRQYEAWIGQFPDDVSLPQTLEGTDFSYSSGTTGMPKGIRRPLSDANAYFKARADPRTRWKDFDESSVYLSTAPFYHTAPVRWNMAVMRAGGSCVLMQKFDPSMALDAIQRHRVTHAQWVPTMFVRLLRLPEQERARFDLSSLRFAIHAAAPCPVHVKEQMIGWWGPVLYEYYSGTELVGRTSIDSEEWLSHKGSVGKPEFGQVHIVDEDGAELPAGRTGVVYFSGGGRFAYHNDAEKTARAYNERGWATYGDVGHLDADGFLYLTDRLANTIVSGGVNIYPQEAENVLLTHEAVADVAVVGVPNEEFGEEVKAVVQLHDPQRAGQALAEELIQLCRARISAIKCPRSVDFVQALPRTESGKLQKRTVKAAYWPSENRIAH